MIDKGQAVLGGPQRTGRTIGRRPRSDVWLRELGVAARASTPREFCPDASTRS